METTKRGRKVALLLGFSFVILLAVLAFMNRTDLRTWYVLWRDFQSLGKNAQGYREYRHRETGIVFVRVPGGRFIMGTPEDEDGKGRLPGRKFDHERQHKVTLRPFLIAKYELNQAEWKRVMGANPSNNKGDNLPVERVSWEDCKEFCRKSGLTLPTEAQWEYACRAGSTTRFAFGDTLSKQQAQFDSGRQQRTVAVDSLVPNSFGLHNMHGNVWEWCIDVYDPEFYSKREASELDPVCRLGSENRVIRGGGWPDSEGSCRSGRRHGLPSDHNNADLGFRPAFPPR